MSTLLPIDVKYFNHFFPSHINITFLSYSMRLHGRIQPHIGVKD